MINYYIGYQQGNGEYVYVDSINDYAIGVSLNVTNAINFINEDMAKNVCEYLNSRDKTRVYIPLMVSTSITELVDNEIVDEEVIDNDTITNE